MTAYFVLNSRITDPEGLAAYRAAVGATFEGHQVELLAANEEATVIEGEPIGTRLVVLRFVDRESAMSWYESKPYREIIGLRLSSTEGTALLVDGIA